RIDDEGLNLRNCVHQLWCEFDSSVLKRSYNTYKLASRVFQLFVQCVFDRRKARVKEWIDVNTRALKSTEKVEGLLRSMEQQFEHVQRTCVNPCDMSCKECHFNCLLLGDHSKEEHNCLQLKHICKEKEEGKKANKQTLIKRAITVICVYMIYNNNNG
ncbi:hypothetical protein RFI_38513, partial [Reticulomyxa filosa]